MISSSKKDLLTPAGGQIPAGRRFLIYWLPLLALCGAIFWQSSFPSIQTPALFPHQDKAIHFCAYGLMALLAARAMSREKPGLSLFVLWAGSAGFSILYGLSDEIHQAFVPGRCADALDLLADLAGSMIGALVYIRFFRHTPRTKKGNRSHE